MNDGYVVTRTQRTGCVWTIPKELRDELKINENEPITLHFGSAQTTSSVNQLLSSDTFYDNIIGLSTDILNTLKIPLNTIISVEKIAKNEFRLGPVISILTFNRIINGKKLGYYKKFAMIKRQNGMLYVFSKQDIDADNQKIRGYYYDHLNDTWISGEFPFPDVVINRCYPNNDETVTLLESVIGAKVFNKNSRISKKDFFNTLNDDRFLCNFIPETQELKDYSQLTKFLERYRKIYLKPINGLKGHGIINLTHTTENLLKCSYQKDNKNHSRILLSIDDVFDVVERSSSGERYIVQQPIQSMEYEGSYFSIRTWAMKNGYGDWVMPGMYASLSCKESFLTNISAGSTIIPLQELFRKIIPNLQLTKTQLMILLEDLTLKTAEALDKRFGPLGLLGIDIMIDQNGKLWLIEANGNPGYISVNKQREYFSWSTYLYKNQLDYAAYLAGFRRTNQINSFMLEESSPTLSNRYSISRPEKGTDPKPVVEEKKTINAMVVVAKKTVQEVRELEVAPLTEFPIENRGSLTNQIRIEARQDVKLEYQVNSDKLNIVGYIPVRLIYKGVSVASGNDMGLIQEILVPFLSEVEIKGLQSTDDVVGKINLASSTVSRLLDHPHGVNETTAKLTVKLTFNCQYTVTRQCLIEVSARLVEDTF